MKPRLVQEIPQDWFERVLIDYANAARKREAQEPADTLERRQEKLALIRLLRDTTDSNSIHARCVAIVGERS